MAMESSSMPPSLFDPVLPTDRLHPYFVHLVNEPANEPTRAALSDVYATFVDPDGNFLNDFQGEGFDARLSELYLHAYFSRSGFTLDRSHNRPDFMVTRDSLTVAVEATTANPSQGTATPGTQIANLKSPDEIEAYVQGELAVRLSGPLLAKLKKQYWKLEHVKDRPLVLAIQAFHDKNSQEFTDTALTQYLFGLRATWTMSDDGELDVRAMPGEGHRKPSGKTVPTGFFGLPESEHISAVAFTNAGTHAKFTRMGYQMGVGNDTVFVVRTGSAFDSEPSAMLPACFSYNLDWPPRVETWGEGLVVIHNPRALHPIPDGFFPSAIDTRLEDGRIASIHRSWHPFASKTLVAHAPHKRELAKLMPPLPPAPMETMSLSKQDFHQLVAVSPIAALAVREEAWLADETGSFLAVVVVDRHDGDWGYYLLARINTSTFERSRGRWASIHAGAQGRKLNSGSSAG